mmetsp:Transcript_58050/g.138139  ORF Transcript_58050/g.138139 Transcript_58050/m.138139 type:complete len:235 (-) Transcript_58050:104-808(-)
MAARSLKLSILLKGFGMSPAEFARKEPKVVLTSLRSEYFRLAKATHPDLAPAAEKESAEKKFVALRQQFEEAQQLLESGVVPSSSTAAHGSARYGTSSASDAEQSQREDIHVYYYHPAWHGDPKPAVEFDTWTKMKGRLLVLSVSLALIAFLKECGAAFAGHTFAWHAGTSVRRWDSFKGEKSAEEPPKEKIRRQDTSERGVDSWYQKRGVSNTRKNYVPRGSDRAFKENAPKI